MIFGSTFHLFLQWYYYTACEVLIRELRNLMMAPSFPERDDTIDQINNNLSALFDALLDLIDVYPFWRKFLSLRFLLLGRVDAYGMSFPLIERSIRKLPSLVLGHGEYETI